jgi:protein-disulfide isomerase
VRKDVYKLAGVAGVLIAAFAVVAFFYLRGERSDRAEQVAQQTRIAERAPTDNTVFVRPHSRSLGPLNAKVTVVEFLDPECESCRAMYPMVKHLLGQYEGRVRFVVRYMPLHPNSLYAAGALEAAGEQGRYWEMLETLFRNQPAWGSHHHPRPELIPDYAREVGLDMQAFERFLSAGSHRRIVEADHADGRTLGVTGTPTFFVNGRLLERLGYETLKALIDEELAK